jgi:hypothetical protein
MEPSVLYFLLKVRPQSCFELWEVSRLPRIGEITRNRCWIKLA